MRPGCWAPASVAAPGSCSLGLLCLLWLGLNWTLGSQRGPSVLVLGRESRPYQPPSAALVNTRVHGALFYPCCPPAPGSRLPSWPGAGREPRGPSSSTLGAFTPYSGRDCWAFRTARGSVWVGAVLSEAKTLQRRSPPCLQGENPAAVVHGPDTCSEQQHRDSGASACLFPCQAQCPGPAAEETRSTPASWGFRPVGNTDLNTQSQLPVHFQAQAPVLGRGGTRAVSRCCLPTGAPGGRMWPSCPVLSRSSL